MALVPYRKYEVTAEDLKTNSIRVAPPIDWLREQCLEGDKLVVNFDSENRDHLVITISKANGNGTGGGEGQ